MSLADTIAQLNKDNGNTSTEETVENPWGKLVHNRALRLSKKQPKLLVRILPPLAGKEIFAEYRQWFTTYQSKTGERTTALTLSANQDPEDPIEGYIQDLDKAGKLVNRFGGKNWPTRRYLFNVVPYKMGQNNQLEMLTDTQGLPDVYVMELNKTQTTELVTALADQMYNPNLNPQATAQYNIQPTQEQKEYAFASSALAYPVYLIRNDTQPVSYTNQVMTNYVLPPLPQGFENKLVDLEALTLPSYKQNKSFVDYIVNQGNSLMATQPNEAPAPMTDAQVNAQMPTDMQSIPTPPAPQAQQPAPAPQQPTQPQFGQTYQAPAQPNAPQPVQPVAPAQPSQSFSQPIPSTPVTPNQPQQQAPRAASQAPVQPAQPSNNPLAGVGTPIANKEQQPAQPAVPQDLSSSVDDILKDAGLNIKL